MGQLKGRSYSHFDHRDKSIYIWLLKCWQKSPIGDKQIKKQIKKQKKEKRGSQKFLNGDHFTFEGCQKATLWKIELGALSATISNEI